MDELNDGDDGVNIDDGDSINVNIQRDHLREHMKTICERELCIYKSMPLLARNNVAENRLNCLLADFWLLKQSKLPKLAKLAKKYLVIPATSAPSERVFSVASRIITNLRNRLKPETAGAILFVNMTIDWCNNQLNQGVNCGH